MTTPIMTTQQAAMIDNMFNRKLAAAGKLGWCQLHNADVPATTYATYRNPTTGATMRVVVCEKCSKHRDIVNDDN